MHVLMISEYPLRSGAVGGGVQGYAYNLSRALAELPDVDVEVAVPQSGRDGITDGETLVIEGIPVHIIGESPRVRGRLRLLAEMPRTVARFADARQPDIIHVQNNALIASAVRRPSVFTVHGINERDTLFRGSWVSSRLRSAVVASTEGRARKRVSNVIAINQYVHQFLRSDGQQRIWDIENAVADSWFNLDRMSEPGRILAPSVIVPRKNIAGLIRAMALVVEAYPSAQLRIAGPLRDEAYGAECRALANALGIADRVEFLGSLAVPEMQDELARAQCLALASFNETSPLVISEAMAAGVPVVASRLCGMPWMVVEGFTGRLVNPHDDADIARALLRVLRDDDCVAMGHAARAQAEDRFRASVVAQRTLAVYGAVLGRNG